MAQEENDLGVRKKRPRVMVPRPVDEEYGEQVEVEETDGLELSPEDDIRKGKHGRKNVVDQACYRMMYQFFKERQTAHHVWTKLKEEGIVLSQQTVSRALYRGYPDRGMQPIAERYKRIIEQCYQKEDYDSIAFIELFSS